MQGDAMKTAATFTARVTRDGKWFVAFSPEFPEGNGQGLTEEEALESLRESILLLMEDRREKNWFPSRWHEAQGIHPPPRNTWLSAEARGRFAFDLLESGYWTP
jgi:predicted RNase H-like HicB family nuclease